MDRDKEKCEQTKMTRTVNNESVQVIVRCRPISEKEIDSDCIKVVSVYPKRGVIEVENPKAKGDNEKNKIFTYDGVYDWNSTQQSIYDETVRPLIASVLEGYNGCVFAYGQTGTGKTYTMEGVDDEDNRGIIPRAFEQIWSHINRTTGVEFLVQVRYLEIYMEEIRDLLKAKNTKPLELREMSGQGVFVSHLHSQTCQSATDMVKAVKIGNHNRTTGATNMNEHSSRSHAIFQISIEMAETEKKSVKMGKLNLVDLAGSERQSKTGATGERLKEASKINKALSSLEDPLYVGLRQRRVTGAEYDEFVDEFMEAVVKRYGQNTLIQFEDFGNHNAFRFLDKYRQRYCTFNDDIQGTASVAVAGLLASKRITGKKISDHKFLFLGAGEAAIGIADLCVKAMQQEGLNIRDARNKIWMFDIDGLLAKGRPEGRLEGHKAFYAKEHAPVKSLLELVKEIQPSVMIGASAAGGAFTPEILKSMAGFNERPVIFALSNPTSKAECTAEAAYTNTEGRCIFSSGSPFGTVEFSGKTFTPGQGNNAYIFPGVAMGVILTGIHHISEEIFLIAAQCIADSVTEENLNSGSLYSPLSTIRECSLNIASKICQHAYDKGIASVYPEPVDKRAYIEAQLYNFNYEPSLPNTWSWPKSPEIKTRPLEHVKLAGKL